MRARWVDAGQVGGRSEAFYASIIPPIDGALNAVYQVEPPGSWVTETNNSGTHRF